MRNKRIRAAKKGGRRSTDFISELHDDLLLLIMSLLPIKDAVVTSCLSTRWRSLWLHLKTLNFDGGAERIKFVKQVNSVIDTYNQSTVEDFRIRYDFDESSKLNIDAWLQFAVDKSVKNLELDFTNCNQNLFSIYESYAFPIHLSHRSIGHIYKWPTAKFAIIEIPKLRKLFLKGVNMRGRTVQQILANSPNLETLSLHFAGRLKYIHDAGAKKLELKHMEIVYCPAIEFICLNDCPNLVSFTYKGHEIVLALSNIPKLKLLDIDEGVTRLENNVFRQITSCLSYLQVLSLDINRPKESLKLATVPELPMVKKLKLSIGAQKDDCLLEFTSIAQACPSLEVFTIELHWLSPVRRRKKVRHAADHPHQHLRLLEFVGYYGRVSDLELAVYVINNASALEKIFIDPRGYIRRGITTVDASLKDVEAARSFVKRQLEMSMPHSRGVELVIL